MEEQDQKFMRAAFEAARKSRKEGNHPFGAVLVDEHGNILLETGNLTVASGDCTAHAETTLMKLASIQYDSQFLSKCTIYASTEPCPMCSGAIFWANVRRVVYGLSQEDLYAMTGDKTQEVLLLPCREMFSRGNKNIEVIGPLLEDEAREVHAGFWS
jgi:tRNA(Arg) A34 adenosine deaminase TadA